MAQTGHKQTWMMLSLGVMVLVSAYLHINQQTHRAHQLQDCFAASAQTRPVHFGLFSLYDRKWHHLMQELYTKYHPATTQYHEQPLIPKIIHQVWVGSPLPERFHYYIASWQKHHPAWKYVLWTDEKVARLKLHNRALYDATTNMGIKADIIKYEVVHQFGGVCADIDFECLKPLDDLHHKYEFYTGISHTGYVELANALFGATPHHPIMKACVETIGDVPLRQLAPMEVITMTGPGHLTRSFAALAPHCEGPVVALPVSYFYPLPNTVQGLKTHREITSWLKPETYAVHYFACSWKT